MSAQFRSLLVLSYLLGLILFSPPPVADAGWGSCAVAAVAAPAHPVNGWEYNAERRQSYYYRNGVVVAGYNHAAREYRTTDDNSASWSEPKRPPWAKCSCDCCGPNCNCGTDCECQPNAVEAVATPALAVDLPADRREFYRNPDGSCVFCSMGMCGLDQNVPAVSTLLWDTDYGPRERGGADPYRVAAVAKKRGLAIWNVTGSATYDWMRWACQTGRGAAIGAGTQHFQTLMGFDPAKMTSAVCNNNSPERIDEYSDAAFHRLHEASGRWCVILDAPPHPERPKYVKWWGEMGGYGQSQVDREMVLRLGDMVQHVGGEGIEDDESHTIMQALATPPDDSGKWFVSLIVSKDCAPCARLKSDWASSPDLQAFAKPNDGKTSWAHFTVYDAADTSQDFRFAGIEIGGYPTVIVQPPRTGVYGDASTVVYQATGYDGNAKKLAAAMSTAMKRYVAALPKREGIEQRRVPPPFTPPPKPSPLPPPSPSPVVPDVVVPGPDVPPTPSKQVPPAAGLVLVFAVFTVGLFVWGKL